MRLGKEALVQGALLTVLVVFLFLNSWRSTVITGLTLPISVIGAYPLPDTANPFAVSSGGGLAKSLYTFGALFTTLVATAPGLRASSENGTRMVL